MDTLGAPRILYIALWGPLMAQGDQDLQAKAVEQGTGNTKKTMLLFKMQILYLESCGLAWPTPCTDSLHVLFQAGDVHLQVLSST